MLFDRLVEANSVRWNRYLHHEFVQKLENGTLSQENFLFYLKQDYIYLINYAKCYARLALNATNARELRFAMKCQNAIIDGEIQLHRSILTMGIDADGLDGDDESLANIAYTRYMLGVGESGDYLDMLVALSACSVGYAYIGKEILQNLKQIPQNHPYKEWIETYSGDIFQAEAREFEEFVNSYSSQVDESKFKRLSKIFGSVVRLEIAFWQHGLEMNTEI